VDRASQLIWEAYAESWADDSTEWSSPVNPTVIGDMYPEVAKGWYVAGGYDEDAAKPRPMVILKLTAGNLAFYQSSEGTSGKDPGTWYPFFGLGRNGYVIKGNLDTMTEGYNQPQIKEIMEALNATYAPVDEIIARKRGMEPLDVTPFQDGLDGRIISRTAYGKAQFQIHKIEKNDVSERSIQNFKNLINRMQQILTNLGFTVTPEDIVPGASKYV